MTYTCRHCGAVSHNPNDAREQYCGACHQYANDPTLIAVLVAREIALLDELAHTVAVKAVVEQREAELRAELSDGPQLFA